VEISTIIPDGTEPHDFEPKAQDLAALSTADVFVYNGLGMEAWAQDAVEAADNEDLIVVETSGGADVIVNTDPEEVEEHGEYDPHIWLSLKGAEIAAQNIRDALAEADPSTRTIIRKLRGLFRTAESHYSEYNENSRLRKEELLPGTPPSPISAGIRSGAEQRGGRLRGRRAEHAAAGGACGLLQSNGSHRVRREMASRRSRRPGPTRSGRSSKQSARWKAARTDDILARMELTCPKLSESDGRRARIGTDERRTSRAQGKLCAARLFHRLRGKRREA
jgi:hypothetical protein